MPNKVVPTEEITLEKQLGLDTYRDSKGNELLVLPTTNREELPIIRLVIDGKTPCEIGTVDLKMILAQLKIPSDLKYDDTGKATFNAPRGIIQKAKALCVPETPTR